MELRTISDTNIKVTPIGVGTWVTGGWMWGGSKENESIEAIKTALENGVNLIDTAPVYGFGKSESIVGRTLKSLNRRDDIIIATKFGLEWDDNERIRRNSSRNRILKEIDDSLNRLQTDYIDIYQVHWPDPNTSLEETMRTLNDLFKMGKIRAVGVSNYNVSQIKKISSYGKLHCVQPPFNMFEQEIKADILPYCIENKISTLTYGSLCRGLLTGKFSKTDTFPKGDLRKSDPKFQNKKFENYIETVNKLKDLADRKNSSVTQLAIEWTISQPGITCALIGMRNKKQAEINSQVMKNQFFDENDFKEADHIIKNLAIKNHS